MRIAAPAFLGFCVLLLAGDAGAARSKKSAKKQAEQRFDQAERHYSAGRFQEALGEYQAAHELFAAPELLFNIAQCHRNLGDRQKAIFFFESYLRERPDAPNRSKVEGVIRLLQDEIEEERRLKAIETASIAASLAAAPVVTNNEPDAFVVVQTPQEPEAAVYEEPWFWAVAGIAVALVATSAVLVTTAGDDRPPTSLGVFDTRE